MACIDTNQSIKTIPAQLHIHWNVNNHKSRQTPRSKLIQHNYYWFQTYFLFDGMFSFADLACFDVLFFPEFTIFEV